jgi:hypothetical protein
MEREDNLRARSSGALSKHYGPDLIRRRVAGPLFRAGGLDPTSNLLTSTGRRTGTLGFFRYDIALPVNATEYVQTRMALTLQVEMRARERPDGRLLPALAG